MIKCPQCNEPVKKEQKFCFACGADLEEEKWAGVSYRSGLTLKPFIIIAAIIVVVGLGYWLFLKPKPKPIVKKEVSERPPIVTSPSAEQKEVKSSQKPETPVVKEKPQKSIEYELFLLKFEAKILNLEEKIGKLQLKNPGMKKEFRAIEGKISQLKSDLGRARSITDDKGRAKTKAQLELFFEEIRQDMRAVMTKRAR